MIEGVNGKIADLLGLSNRQILGSESQPAQKIAVFVPLAEENLMKALFEAGAGDKFIKPYSDLYLKIRDTIFEPICKPPT